jgi:hypothetical protein
MKIKVTRFAFISAIALSAGYAEAQTIPPPCERYITAVNICGADLVRLEETTKPEKAASARASMNDTVKTLTSGMREVVRRKGVDEAAKLCASPAFSSQMIPQITNMMTMLSTGDAASEGCQDAYGRLVLPTLTQ